MADKKLTPEQQKIVTQVLGHTARLVSGSKSTYRMHNQKNVVIFNSNVVAEGYGKIWYGDLDLTLEEGKLISLASGLKTKIFLLYEMDGRFAHEDKPRLDLAVYETDGVNHNFGGRYKDYIHRDKTGKIILNG